MKVSIQKKDITLREPFLYYLDTLIALPYAQITITTSDNVSGVGEVPCAIDINGETAEGSIHLASVVERCLSVFSIHSEKDIKLAMETLSLKLAFNEALRFGVEQALFEILTKRKNKSLSNLFGVTKKEIKMQVTLPYLDSKEEYDKKLEMIFEKKPTHLKIKVGANLKREISVIKTARSLSDAVCISVDANQAFKNPGDAVVFLKEVESYNLSWIEQPLTRYALIEDWLMLKKSVSVPLMADESIHTQKDVQFFLQNKAIDYLNIKLAKCGGIFEARKIIETAKKYNIPVMLGSMLEGEKALKYNLAFGLSEDFIVYDFSRNYVLEDKKIPLFINEKTLYSTKEVLL